MQFTRSTNSRGFKTVPKSSWENSSQQNTPPIHTLSEETSTSEESSNPNIYSAENPTFARVEWVDACSHGGPGWVDLDEAREFAISEPPVMKTVGYILYYDPEPGGWIALTDTLGGEETSSVHKIPSCMIQFVETLPCDK